MNYRNSTLASGYTLKVSRCVSFSVVLEFMYSLRISVCEQVVYEARGVTVTVEMGAYTKSAASTFNGYSKAHSYYIITKELKLVAHSFIEVSIRTNCMNTRNILDRKCSCCRTKSLTLN